MFSFEYWIEGFDEDEFVIKLEVNEEYISVGVKLRKVIFE